MQLEAVLLYWSDTVRGTRCDEFRLDYYLQPGDIQLLNNHTCLHTRGAFTDFPVRPACCSGECMIVRLSCMYVIPQRQACTIYVDGH